MALQKTNPLVEAEAEAESEEMGSKELCFHALDLLTVIQQPGGQCSCILAAPSPLH